MTEAPENPFCVRALADLRIRSEHLVLEEITDELKLKPTHTLRKGDLISPHSGEATRPWSVWTFSTESLVASALLSAHAHYLADTLEPRKAALAKYVEDPRFYVDIYLDCHTDCLEGGYTLSSATLARLAALSRLITFGFLVRRAPE